MKLESTGGGKRQLNDDVDETRTGNQKRSNKVPVIARDGDGKCDLDETSPERRLRDKDTESVK